MSLIHVPYGRPYGRGQIHLSEVNGDVLAAVALAFLLSDINFMIKLSFFSVESWFQPYGHV